MKKILLILWAIFAGILILGIQWIRRPDVPQTEIAYESDPDSEDIQQPESLVEVEKDILPDPDDTKGFKIQRFESLQAAIRRNRPDEIAEVFSFPYRLPQPVPPIQTAEEFVLKIHFEGRFEYRFTTASYDYSIRTLTADHPVSPSGYLLVFRDDDMIFREYFP